MDRHNDYDFLTREGQDQSAFDVTLTSEAYPSGVLHDPAAPYDH